MILNFEEFNQLAHLNSVQMSLSWYSCSGTCWTKRASWSCVNPTGIQWAVPRFVKQTCEIEGRQSLSTHYWADLILPNDPPDALLSRGLCISDSWWQRLAWTSCLDANHTCSRYYRRFEEYHVPIDNCAVALSLITVPTSVTTCTKPSPSTASVLPLAISTFVLLGR